MDALGGGKTLDKYGQIGAIASLISGSVFIITIVVTVSICCKK